jgi:HEAT repeat protein
VTRIGRDRIRALVAGRRLDDILSLVDEGRPILRHLRGLLLSEDDLLRDRAAEAVGVVAGRLNPNRAEQVRNLVQGLLWSLNDEAGMSGRGSPEALGRIVLAIPELASDIIPILISYLDNEQIALEDEILDAGVLASLGRLGCDVVQMSDEGCARMAGLLRDPHPRLRGLAAWTAGELGLVGLRDALDGLRGDQDVFPLYLDGALTSPTVGQVAEEALQALRCGTT